MAFCPSLNFSPHDTFKAASQLEENVKSEIEQMKIDDEREGRRRFLNFRENHMVHYLSSFTQPRFATLGRRLKSVVWEKVEAWTNRHRPICATHIRSTL
jgi:hypothetical protein